MITVTQLRAFLTVARAGSVTVAAEQLYVSQPSVSAALSALARELGAEVVEREGRTIRLTEAGRAFEPYADQVLGLLEQGKLAAVEAERRRKARIRVVAVNTAGEYLVPQLIQAYRQIAPDTEIRLEVANRRTMIERLQSHRADVGFGGRPPSTAIDGKPCLDNELVVAGREIPPDLGDVPWLLRETGSGTRARADHFLRELGLETAEQLTLGSIGAVKQAMKVGLGITLISADAIRRELREGELVRIPVPGTPILGSWYVLLPRGVPTRPAVRAFCEFVHSAGARKIIEEAL